MTAAPAVKICGITNAEDALVAAECGAKYLGLIFVRSSKRSLNAAAAREIAREVGDRGPELVGVFMNESADQIARTCEAVPLHHIQLHGQESPEFCSELHARLSLPVIKAVELFYFDSRDQSDLVISSYIKVCSHVLIDRPKAPDAAGISSDWLVLATAKMKSSPPKVPYFFAGGLNADNIGVVAADICPHAFDVASGVESALGKKDHAKLRAFFTALRSPQAVPDRSSR